MKLSTRSLPCHLTNTAHHTLVHGYTHVPITTDKQSYSVVKPLLVQLQNRERLYIKQILLYHFLQFITNDAKIIVFIKPQTQPYTDKDSPSI